MILHEVQDIHENKQHITPFCHCFRSLLEILQAAVLGWPLVAASVTPQRAGITLERWSWPPLWFLSWELHILFIYYSYADKFQTHVSTSDLFCSAQRPMLITSGVPSVPPASPQNELLELPSKCHKTALQNIHSGARRGELKNDCFSRSLSHLLKDLLGVLGFLLGPAVTQRDSDFPLRTGS